MPDIFVSPDQTEKVAKKTAVGKTTDVAVKIDPSGSDKHPDKSGSLVKNMKFRKKFHFLAAFVDHPGHLRFENQRDEEKILLLLRRHLITNLSWIFMTLLMAVAPLVVYYSRIIEPIPDNFKLVSVICWYLLTFAFAYEHFLLWYFNVNVITNERVVDFDFPSILYKEINECQIEKIEEVDTRTGGFIRSIFTYGDVVVQTAGAVAAICFNDVPNPGLVAEMLNNLMEDKQNENK